MNGELEKLITDCNVIHEDNGNLVLDACHRNDQKLAVKKPIVEALANYLNKGVVEKEGEDNW
jgi:hypothetical protein